MFLTIFALPAIGKKLLPNETSGMRVQGRHLTYQVFFGCSSPLSNAHGRAAFWLSAALALLVICSVMAVLYFTSGIRNKRTQPAVSLDQKEGDKPAKLYKISMPARKAVQIAPGSLSDTATRETPAEGDSEIPSEAIGGQMPTALERTDNQRIAGPDGDAYQQNKSSPTQIDKQSVKETEKGSSIAAREDVDPKLSPGQKEGAQEVPTGLDVAAKTEKGVSHEVDKAASQAGAEAGKRLFVKVHIGNVREEPSMTSRVKFRLKTGDPVTVTGKRRGWVSVKLDDGRFGWVYHTLLTDSIVPQEATPRAAKTIKMIRREVAAEDVAKVIFELNGPFSPETMIVEGENPRVVCDFFNAGFAPDIPDSIEINNGIVEKIRTGVHKWPKFKVRVVLDLVPGRNYEIDEIFLEKENHYVLVVKTKE